MTGLFSFNGFVAVFFVQVGDLNKKVTAADRLTRGPPMLLLSGIS